MKQQNKLSPCPSAALGHFIGLILYDHRRAIAWSKLISSKRQWVKERGKKNLHSDGSLLPETGGPRGNWWTRTENSVQTPVWHKQLLPTSVKHVGVKSSGKENANKTIMTSPCFAKQRGLASVGGVGCLTRTNAVYESRVFASNHNVYSHGPASSSCFPSDW